MSPRKLAIEPAPTYRHLSPRLAQLLYCLAILARKKEIGTRHTLAVMMQVSRSNISYLLNQLKTGPAPYVKTYPGHAGLEDLAQTVRAPGRLPAAYYLDIERVISLPETARIAVEAWQLSRQTGNLAQSKLISHIAKNYGLQRAFIKGRIDYCLRNAYLVGDEQKQISASERVMSEFSYLNLLASDCKTVGSGRNGPKKV